MNNIEITTADLRSDMTVAVNKETSSGKYLEMLHILQILRRAHTC